MVGVVAQVTQRAADPVDDAKRVAATPKKIHQPSRYEFRRRTLELRGQTRLRRYVALVVERHNADATAEKRTDASLVTRTTEKTTTSLKNSHQVEELAADQTLSDPPPTYSESTRNT